MNLLQAAIDKVVGACLLCLSASIFVYYTLWVIITVRYISYHTCSICGNSVFVLHAFYIQPFIDQDQAIQEWFPDRQYAVMIPAALLVLAITMVVTFVGVVFIKTGRKTKKD